MESKSNFREIMTSENGSFKSSAELTSLPEVITKELDEEANRVCKLFLQLRLFKSLIKQIGDKTNAS